MTIEQVSEPDRKLADEAGRLSALKRYRVLDSEPEAAFERITSLVRIALDVPIAAVALVDANRQWFKSIKGMGCSEGPRDAALCAATILSREPLVVTDAAEDPRFNAHPAVLGDPHIRSYLGVPLRSPDGYNIGSLCASDTKPRDFSSDNIKILESLADLVIQELELRTLAQQDYLTGAMTRRTFQEEASKEFERFRRYGRPASIVVFDIDHFKSINDTYGHPTGDDLLREVGACCTAALRPSDSFGRIGGEEFAMLLPETLEDDAFQCAERLRLQLAALPFAADPSRHITASFGVASLQEHNSGFDCWMASADAGLYSAKRTGRNRTVSINRLLRLAA